MEIVFWSHESREKLGHFRISLLAIWFLFETSGETPCWPVRKMARHSYSIPRPRPITVSNGVQSSDRQHTQTLQVEYVQKPSVRFQKPQTQLNRFVPKLVHWHMDVTSGGSSDSTQLPLEPKKPFTKILYTSQKVPPKKIPRNVESVILLPDSISRKRVSEILKALRLSRYRG